MNIIKPPGPMKKNLADEIRSTVQNEIEYNAYSGSIIKNVTENLQSSAEIFIATIEQVIMENKFNSLQKFYALKLLEAAMESSSNLNFAGELAETSLLENLRDLAEFRKEDPNDARGASLFGENKQQMHAKNFFIMLLEFFEHWGSSFTSAPRDSKISIYPQYYSELLELGVTFPQRARFIAVSRSFNSVSPIKTQNELAAARSQINLASHSERDMSYNDNNNNSIEERSYDQINNSKSRSGRKPPAHIGKVPSLNSVGNSQIHSPIEFQQIQEQSNETEEYNVVSNNYTSMNQVKSSGRTPSNPIASKRNDSEPIPMEDSKEIYEDEEEEKDEPYYEGSEGQFYENGEHSQLQEVEQEPEPRNSHSPYEVRGSQGRTKAEKPRAEEHFEDEENFDDRSMTKAQSVPVNKYEQVDRNPLVYDKAGVNEDPENLELEQYDHDIGAVEDDFDEPSEQNSVHHDEAESRGVIFGSERHVSKEHSRIDQGGVRQHNEQSSPEQFNFDQEEDEDEDEEEAVHSARVINPARVGSVSSLSTTNVTNPVHAANPILPNNNTTEVRTVPTNPITLSKDAIEVRNVPSVPIETTKTNTNNVAKVSSKSELPKETSAVKPPSNTAEQRSRKIEELNKGGNNDDDEAAREVEELKKEKIALQKRIEELENTQINSKELAAQHQRISSDSVALIQENKSLVKKLETLAAEKKEGESNEKKLRGDALKYKMDAESVQREKKELHDQINALSKENEKNLDELSMYRTENQRLKDDKKSLTKENALYKDNKVDKERENELQNGIKMQDILRQNDDLQDRIKELENELLIKNKEISNLAEANSALTRELQDKERILEELHNTAEGLQAKDHEILDLNTANVALEIERSELTDQLQQSQQRAQELESQCEQIQKQLGEYEQTVEQQQQALEENKGILEEQQKALEEREQQLEQIAQQQQNEEAQRRKEAEIVLDKNFLLAVQVTSPVDEAFEKKARATGTPNLEIDIRSPGNRREKLLSNDISPVEQFRSTAKLESGHSRNTSANRLAESRSIGLLLRENLNVSISTIEPPYNSPHIYPQHEIYKVHPHQHIYRERVYQDHISPKGSPAEIYKNERPAQQSDRELIVGRLVDTPEFLRAFEEYLDSIVRQNERQDLKPMAFSNSFVLHEDNNLAVTVESALQYDVHVKKNRVAFRMRFKNKTSAVLDDVDVEFEAAEGLKLVRESGRLSREIQPLLDEIQTLYVYLDGIPQGLPLLNLSYRKENDLEQHTAPLPVLVNRFLEFKKTSSEEFRIKWGQWKRLYPTSIFKTGDITVNPDIITRIDDFQRISDKLVEIPFKNQWKAENYIKLGGIFNLEYLGVEYLMRIFIDRELAKAVIQVISYASKESMGIAVANYLAFLLQAP